MNCKHLVAAVALAAVIPGLTPAVHAQSDDLPELNTSSAIRRPVVITRPGHYVLDHDLVNLPGTAIRIEANEVTLDLGGHRIVGPGNREGVGIDVVGAANVHIHNGHLGRLGIGVRLMGATNVVVEDLQIDGVDSGGAPPDVEIGILLINSRGCRISKNTITETFLGIFVRGEGSGGNYVTGNVITGGDQGELAICYNPVPGGTGGPDGDLVADNLVSRFRRGLSFSDGSLGNVVRDNTVAYFDIDIEERGPGQNLIEDNQTTQIPR